MKKKIVTYGVPGMLEWHALLKIGNSHLRINFTGGSLSGYGVTPATFTTDNAALQRIIEQSNEFKSKRIKIVKCIVAEDSGQTERPKIIKVANEIERDRYILAQKLMTVEEVGNVESRERMMKERNIKFVMESEFKEMKNRKR